MTVYPFPPRRYHIETGGMDALRRRHPQIEASTICHHQSNMLQRFNVNYLKKYSIYQRKDLQYNFICSDKGIKTDTLTFR